MEKQYTGKKRGEGIFVLRHFFILFLTWDGERENLGHSQAPMT
jgi:hypothetical protein